MGNLSIGNFSDADKDFVHQLKQWCFDLNGCCQTVHKEIGPFLNEYIYQDALEIVLTERNITFQKEYYFTIDFHGKRIRHKHYVDFYCKNIAFIECKAVESLGIEHRQQLWNYMRLTKTKIGILWNFAPVKDQSEHYYYDIEKDIIYLF